MHDYQRPFRDCLGCFATGVTIITTLSGQKAPIGLTVNSYNSVSLDPPLILFSLGKESFSVAHFLESDHFAVNILSSNQISLSRHFAIPSNNKWKDIPFSPGKHTECPIFPYVLAYLECKKEAVHDGGDHWIFIGRVLYFDQVSDEQPLLYYKGDYHTMGQPCGGNNEPKIL